MTTNLHRSHGWRDDTVAPDWPALTSADVLALAAQYPVLQANPRIVWHSPRPFSSAARVWTARGELFIKRHHCTVRSVQDLHEEHAFIAHLLGQGLPVPRVLPAADGETAIAQGGWSYELHATAAGVDVYRDAASWTPPRCPGHARSAGQLLARLHRAAATFTAPDRSTALLVNAATLLCAPDLFAAIEAQCLARPALADALHAIDWRRQLACLLPRHRHLQPLLAAQQRLWTHGDWHVSNLFWESDQADARICSILDFGLCAPTFALFDLATAIERNAILWLQPDPDSPSFLPDIARNLLAGYAELSPLLPAQRELLAALLPLVHLDFALSELQYFHAVTRKPDDARLAWEGYLLGHAQWFDTAPGQRLLALIRGTG
ncbi:MAG: phosphotransferase [Xanthomonadaceae bacterium]|nr:phosphotransferase [Xanthomonadaceae bacterium]